jgi:hypothetical protein
MLWDIPVNRKDYQYRSFLLRIWVEPIDGKPTWRLSVEDPLTSKRRGFTSFGELCAYLVG